MALDICDGKQRDIWVYDWARDTLTQLTFDPGNDAFRSGRPTASASCSDPTGPNPAAPQPVLGERRRHGRGDAADRQPGRASTVVVASERQVPGVHRRSCRHGLRSDDPADGGRRGEGLDAGHAHRLSGHAGERGRRRCSRRTAGSSRTFDRGGAAPYDVYVRPFPGPGGHGASRRTAASIPAGRAHDARAVLGRQGPRTE